MLNSIARQNLYDDVPLTSIPFKIVYYNRTVAPTAMNELQIREQLHCAQNKCPSIELQNGKRRRDSFKSNSAAKNSRVKA
jgi:hypothetical protein